ncbi:BnaC03g30590D [Brassica napus]|uniref:BnaC03g30590D protein n=1 Tax=Brassica napus TaxID=3708 RepID=A0A078FYW0_BRANA|nr:BnaC03g30590D [Brassica napus]
MALVPCNCFNQGSLLFRLICLISRHRERSDECEPLEKSCLTEEHEKYLSDGSQSSKKRIRDASPSTALLSESKKKKKHKTSKESRYSSLNSDDWLLGTRWQENVSTKSTMNEDMVMNLQKPGESCFPSSQLLSEVGIFSLPYTVLF